MRIAFVIRSLATGGAERQLVTLACGLAAKGHAITVITFYPGGTFTDALRHAGVKLLSLQKRSRWDLLGPSKRLYRILCEIDPHVVHAYMPVECAVGLIAARTARIPFVWGVRAASLPLALYDRVSRLSYCLQPHLVRFADLVISNSAAGLESLGKTLDRTKALVIPNGIDVERFRPDGEQRTCGRELLGVDATIRVIAKVGRLDPVKAHDVFLRGAARCVERSEVPLRFVVAGGGSAQQFQRLQQLARELRISDQVTWLPELAQPELVYNAADLVVSTSLAEGFSNALAEALACGAPVVASRVGDASTLVTPGDRLVEPGDDGELAEAMLEILQTENVDRAIRHQSIAERYSIALLVNRTERALEKLLRIRGRDA